MTITRASMLVFFLSACAPATDDKQACTAYQSAIDLAQPSVSFQKDVVPILQQNCALSACHGSNVGKNNGVYLGAPQGSVDAARVYGAIVGVSSPTAPSLSFVAAGDPQKSFIMHKMDGDLCTLTAQCTGSCGITMPKDAAQLGVAPRDVVRRWIAQGAVNN